MVQQVFVARERELSQLDRFLQQAISGKGMACFVSGEAGSGKTALVTEFARRALEHNNDLVVAIGQSNAQTGSGDAYLPFREIMGQLTGDIKAKHPQAMITRENATRLSKLLILTSQALVELGPDLIGIFIPGAALAMKVGAFAAKKVGWLDKLENIISKRPDIGGITGSAIDQSHIFEQYTNVVCRLSEKSPFILILDDLQWADIASNSLLFHLARHIETHRILLLGTYRPEEVSIGRDGTRHPLEKVLAELKRYYGNIWVDLDNTDELEACAFIDAFLNSEPNQLNPKFRQMLFQHTSGHPLFTIELLRNMQERGDLVKDRLGMWIETPKLVWEQLPVRVEGVIEERIGRLEENLRQMMTIASVEGEDFTAEVIARIQAINASGLIRVLGSELERKHRLIKSRGIQQMDEAGRRLSLYRFQHNLFQQYLYHQLDEAERTYLHEDVGNTLEELFAGQANQIAVQLAKHFEEAGNRDKARKYLAEAGNQSALRFANEEAANYYSRALRLTPVDNLDDRFNLLLKLEQIHSLQGERELQAQDLAAMEEMVQSLGDYTKQVELLLQQALYADEISDYQTAIIASQKTINLAQSIQDMKSQASAHYIWGTALRHQGDYIAAQQQYENAHTLAHNAESRHLEAKSLAGMGMVLSRQGDLTGAQSSFEEGLSIYQELGDLCGEADILQHLCATILNYGDYNRAQSFGEKALRIYKQIGYKQREGNIQSNLGIIFAQQGDYAHARNCFLDSLDIAQDTGDRGSQAAVLNNLGNLALRQDDFNQANECFNQVLEICREIGNRRGEGISLSNLASVAKYRSDYELVKKYRNQSLEIFRAIGDKASEGFGLNSLGDIYRVEGNYGAARKTIMQGLEISREVGDRQTECNSLENLALIAIACGMYSEAEKLLIQSLDITHQIGDRQLEGQILADLGRLHYCLNDNEKASDFSKQAIAICEELGERSSQGRVLTILGHAMRAQRNIPEAVEAYQKSLVMLGESGQLNRKMEALAGLAQLYTDQNRLKEAESKIEEILNFLDSHTLEGTVDPMGVYLACFRVLTANRDPRAKKLLNTAYRELQERTAMMEDGEMCRSYLENVTVNREIILEFNKFN